MAAPSPCRAWNPASKQAGPKTTLFDDNVSAKKPVAVALDRCRQSPDLQFRFFRSNPHQHNARDGALPTKHEIAEILVISEQDSVFVEGKGDDVGVAQPPAASAI